MPTHLHAECLVWFGVSQFNYSSSTKSVQREERGIESETGEATFHPIIEVTPLDGSPAIPRGNLEDGSLGSDVVVTHGPGQALQGSDGTEERVI